MSAAAAMHQTIASGAPPAPTATHKLSPPPTATATAPSPAGPPPDAAAPQLNGNAADASPAARKASATAAKSEPSLVAVIRAEQACQMAQARSKGDLHQVQKRMEKDTLRGSGAAWVRVQVWVRVWVYTCVDARRMHVQVWVWVWVWVWVCTCVARGGLLPLQPWGAALLPCAPAAAAPIRRASARRQQTPCALRRARMRARTTPRAHNAPTYAHTRSRSQPCRRRTPRQSNTPRCAHARTLPHPRAHAMRAQLPLPSSTARRTACSLTRRGCWTRAPSPSRRHA
jgi:hypothetical protein